MRGTRRHNEGRRRAREARRRQRRIANGRMGAFETRCKGTIGSHGTLCHEIIVPLDSPRHGTAPPGSARLGLLSSPTMEFVALPANFQQAETYDCSSNPVFIWKQRPRRANQGLSSAAKNNCDFRYSVYIDETCQAISARDVKQWRSPTVRSVIVFYLSGIMSATLQYISNNGATRRLVCRGPTMIKSRAAIGLNINRKS